jgi:hypothetical protein
VGNPGSEASVTTKIPELGQYERELILNYARLDVDSRLRKRTEEILHKPLDWEAVLFFAKFHSVSSLIYHNLKLFDILDLIPREARRTLLRLSHRTEYQNRLLSKELNKIVKLFAEAQIPVMVPKGIALVELIYGDCKLRPLIDLNMVIPKNKIDIAKEILLKNGYRAWAQDPSQGSLFSQLHLAKLAESEVHVLLQWHLINWPRINAFDMNRVWEEAQHARLAGQQVLILSPVDLVLYLCLQPDKHGVLNIPAVQNEDPAKFVFTEWTNNRLIRFVDIYEAIRHHKEAIDWKLFLQRSVEAGIDQSVYASLNWVSKIMGRVVDSSVIEAISPPTPRLLRQRFFNSVAQFSNHNRTNPNAKALFSSWWLKKRKLFQLRTFQVLSLLEFTFPRPDELRFAYRHYSRKNAVGFYLYHVIKTFFRGLLPWMYCILIKRRLLRMYSPKYSIGTTVR